MSPKVSTTTFLLITTLVIITLLSSQVSAFGETVPRAYCPNRCHGIGHCSNQTLSDAEHVSYKCECGYESKHLDCNDQAHIPLLWTIILTVFIILVFGITFTLFERCNKAFDARQKFYSPDSVLAR